MNEELISLIEENYPFTKKQDLIWKEIKRDILDQDSLCDQNVVIIDKLISRLRDGHMRMKCLIPPQSIFVVDLLWKGNHLIMIKDGKSYVVEKVNDKSVVSLIELYQLEYGLENLFVKRQMIADIKNGSDIFQGNHLKIQYTLESVSKEMEFTKTSIQDLKATVSDETLKLLKSLKSLLVKKMDQDTLYIKITSFYDRNIVEKFLEDVSQQMDEHICNVIIDIRDNSGGYIDLAKELASFVIDEKIQLDYEVLDAKGFREQYEIDSRKMPELSHKRMFLFVNQNTQSSAEYIFARALKLSNENIIIVGNTTAGLSGQAKEYIINDRYMLSVTTKRYVVPGTFHTVSYGITPGIIIDEDNDTSDVTKDSYIEWYMWNKNMSRG